MSSKHFNDAWAEVDASPGLWIGMLMDVFQLPGTVPLEIDRLEKCYNFFFMYSTLMQSKKQSIRVRPNSQTANVEAAHNKKGQVTT